MKPRALLTGREARANLATLRPALAARRVVAHSPRPAREVYAVYDEPTAAESADLARMGEAWERREDGHADRRDDLDHLRAAIARLAAAADLRPIHQDTIALYLRGLSLVRIGDARGVSRAAVHEVWTVALARLRLAASANGIDDPRARPR